MEKERHASMLVPYVRRRLAVVPSTPAPAPGSPSPFPSPSSSSRFSVPRGWAVEEVPRRDGSRSDVYYYEPGTGKKFRSIRAVNRYLKQGEYPSRPIRRLTLRNHISVYQRKIISLPKVTALSRSKISRSSRQIRRSAQIPRTQRMVVSGGKLLKLDEELSHSEDTGMTAPYVLPDGWIVEEVPRRHGKMADRYYYEPGTGQKFRSLAGVERYLTELDDDNAPLSKALEEIKENKPLSKIFKLENYTKNSIPRNRNAFGEKRQASSFLDPPSKVNWVIASPQGDEWSPFISETLVTDAVKQEWKDRFMLLMNDESHDFQST